MAVALQVFACEAALAHDTWFQRLDRRPDSPILALGTGNRYPAQEFPIAAGQLRTSGCRVADGTPASFQPLQVTSRALLIRALRKPSQQSGGMSCWAESVAFDLELSEELVQVYLDEIAATEPVRAQWRSLQARGVRWKERYVKHARIDLPGAREATTGRAMPAGMGIELVMEGGPRAVAPGEPLVFQLLRDGQPLEGQPIELVDERGGSKAWLKTDREGRLQLSVPTPGPWLLRGTELRLSSTLVDTWESRFVTLVFEGRAD